VALFPDLSLLGYVPRVKERRAHYRRRVNQDAELVIPGEYLTLPCRITNISPTGAGVVCDVVPCIATNIKLVMNDGRVFEGATAWFENGRLGIRFSTGSDD
jgi:hypothetical protein